VLGVAIFAWSSAAFAQSYSALDGSAWEGPNVGVGGIYLSGDDTEFLPTVSVSGVTDYLAWQAFYGFGSDSSIFGGSLDYIFANNWDDCESCPETSVWWVGAGATIVSYSDLFLTGTGEAATGLDDTEIGANLGLGWTSGEWGLNLYLHYLPSNEIVGVQGGLTYNFGGGDE
jgi:hypothetical protein